MTSLSGSQFVQRGKKFAMVLGVVGSEDRPPPHKKRIKSETHVCFVQAVQGLMFVARLRGDQDSMNWLGEGKIKFVLQSHVD